MFRAMQVLLLQHFVMLHECTHFVALAICKSNENRDVQLLVEVEGSVGLRELHFVGILEQVTLLASNGQGDTLASLKQCYKRPRLLFGVHGSGREC